MTETTPKWLTVEERVSLPGSVEFVKVGGTWFREYRDGRGRRCNPSSGQGALLTEVIRLRVELRDLLARASSGAEPREDTADAERWRAFKEHAYVASAGPRRDYYLTGGDFLRDAPPDGFSPDSFADALIAARRSPPAPEGTER